MRQGLGALALGWLLALAFAGSAGAAAVPEGPMEAAAPAADLLALGTDAAPAPFCEGDGQSGSRIQAVYGHIAGTSQVLDRPLIEGLAGRVDEAYDDSAGRQGGAAHPRWAMEPGTCRLSIITVELPAGAPSDFDLTLAAMSAAGLRQRTDRKYMVWVDGSGSEGLIANSPTDEDTTDPALQAADGGQTLATVAQITRDNWDVRTDGSIRWGAQHELAHMLGAVNPGAPHYVGGKHCDDGPDAMCFADGSSPACPAIERTLLDCNGDDYFGVSPASGSYLEDHWNTYDSSFLVRSDIRDSPPETSLLAGPSGTVAARSAEFTFSSSEAGGFECRLDGGAFLPCQSPRRYDGLASGPHSFAVRAVDAAGNRDYSAATRGWTVAAPPPPPRPPQTTITGAKVNSKKRTATVTFAGSGGSGLSFECRLDGGAYAACSSPLVLRRLKRGRHEVAVRSRSGSLTDPTPATRSFKVKRAKRKRRG